MICFFLSIRQRESDILSPTTSQRYKTYLLSSSKNTFVLSRTQTTQTKQVLLRQSVHSLPQRLVGFIQRFSCILQIRENKTITTLYFVDLKFYILKFCIFQFKFYIFKILYFYFKFYIPSNFIFFGTWTLNFIYLDILYCLRCCSPNFIFCLCQTLYIFYFLICIVCMLMHIKSFLNHS